MQWGAPVQHCFVSALGPDCPQALPPVCISISLSSVPPMLQVLSPRPFAQADPLPQMLFPHTRSHLASPTLIPGVGLVVPSSGKPSLSALFSAPPRHRGFGAWAHPARCMHCWPCIRTCGWDVGQRSCPPQAELQCGSQCLACWDPALSLAWSLHTPMGSLIWHRPSLTIHCGPPIAPCSSVCATLPGTCVPGGSPWS